MNGNKSHIPESELALLKLLWEESPLGAADLHARLSIERDWSITTVKTLLARLVAKGSIAAKRDGRRFLYTPLVEHEQVAARQAGGLVDRLFGGRVSPLVAQLAEEREISKDDLDELEAIIRKLRQ